ncbi:CMT1A duplicated region transcript 4 protein homolog [Heteronotia binoei]|uniref:CMT1A duplicated region transcript 4 protein homolog n=1 Tax=Heteronotia binoei TaxID=13085 RepID=UPI002931E868|nr:CMT1A duplicated region transcript 4 protein homolog [Heteronotia binoei]
MATFFKDILEPSQRDIFNQLTQVKITMAFSIISLKDRDLLSSNIGLPSHLIQSCRQWPAYTNYTSPIVKKIAEQDKLRIAKMLPTPQISSEKLHSTESYEDVVPQRKHCYGSQQAGTTETSPAFSYLHTPSSPLWMWKDVPGDLGVQTSPLPLGLTASSNVVIFSRRAPFHVLPMKLPDITQYRKIKTVRLQE